MGTVHRLGSYGKRAQEWRPPKRARLHEGLFQNEPGPCKDGFRKVHVNTMTPHRQEYPKRPDAHVVYTSATKYLCRSRYVSQVCSMLVHGTLKTALKPHKLRPYGPKTKRCLLWALESINSTYFELFGAPEI